VAGGGAVGAPRFGGCIEYVVGALVLERGASLQQCTHVRTIPSVPNTFFHTTAAAEEILQNGFRDAEGSYGLVTTVFSPYSSPTSPWTATPQTSQGAAAILAYREVVGMR
jgi:hypothetical protein